MKTRKLYGLIKKAYYEKRKDLIFYFFFLLIPFLLVSFHLFLRNISDKYSLEIYNATPENDKIDLNDTIRQYVLFLSNELCSKEVEENVYINHICVTPDDNISRAFVAYANEVDLNIFRVYKSEEECLKNLKYAIQLRASDLSNLNKKQNGGKDENKKISNLISIIKNNLKQSDSVTLDELYGKIHSQKNYDDLLSLHFDEETKREIKKTKLYKSFIKDMKNLKDESSYNAFFKDEKKKIFFFNFVKSNLIQTNKSCGLLAIENVTYSDEESKLSFSYVLGRKPSWEIKNDAKYNHMNGQNSRRKFSQNDRNENQVKGKNEFAIYPVFSNEHKNKKDVITNVSYKIRVGDYALIESSEDYFFNDININLKQNFVNFSTIDDLSFNIYFNEWYYRSFFIVLEYHFNLFLLRYNSSVQMAYSDRIGSCPNEKRDSIYSEKYNSHSNEKYNSRVRISSPTDSTDTYSSDMPKNPVEGERQSKSTSMLHLNDFFLVKMPMRNMKINAFDAFEKNIFRVVMFLCVCLFIVNICFDINKERKMNMENFLFCLKINKYYYYFSWLLFYFLVLFVYNILFSYIIYVYIYKRFVHYFIVFTCIYFFMMNSLLFTIICMQFSDNSVINYIASFLFFFLFSSFRLIIHSGIGRVLSFLVLLIPHASFCLALDFFFILIKNDIPVYYSELFIKFENISLMHLFLHSLLSFLLLICILTYMIYYRNNHHGMLYQWTRKKNKTVRKSETSWDERVANSRNTFMLQMENHELSEKLCKERFTYHIPSEETKPKKLKQSQKPGEKQYRNSELREEHYRNNESDDCYLIIKNVNKTYGRKHVLKDVSLTLRNNRIFVLLGENGSGKSTLINIITKMITKDSGEISFFKNRSKKKKKLNNLTRVLDTSADIPNNGHNILTNLSTTLPNKCRKIIQHLITSPMIGKIWKKRKNGMKLSYCSQNVILYENLTFFETIIIFLLYYNKNIEKYLKKKRTLKIMNDLDLSPYLNHKIKDLIDDVKKKISIFICFLVKRDVYILDEPFIALDIKTKTKLFKFFDKIKKNNILFICTHDIYEANYFANDIAIIKSGHIIFSGSKSQFLKLVDYKFVLNIRFNNQETEKQYPFFSNSGSIQERSIRSARASRDGLTGASKDDPTGDCEKLPSNHNRSNLFKILTEDINTTDRKNIETVKKHIIDFVKIMREENKTCFIFFNSNYVYCTYKINETESLKKLLYLLRRFKNILTYQLKTIDIYYTYIYIYSYSEKKNLLMNVHDRDLSYLIKMDPLFYLFFANVKYFNELNNNMLISKSQQSTKHLPSDFGYLRDILIKTKNRCNSQYECEKRAYLTARESDEFLSIHTADCTPIVQSHTQSFTQVQRCRHTKDTMMRVNNFYIGGMIKRWISLFATYVKPSLYMKLKKDLSNTSFYWYKFWVPIFLLSLGLLIIKCVSLFGKVKNIELDYATISSNHLKKSTLNYYIIYTSEMISHDDEHKMQQVVLSTGDNNKTPVDVTSKWFQKWNWRRQEKKVHPMKEIKNDIQVKKKGSVNNIFDFTENNFLYYNNTIKSLLDKHCINEKIRYIDEFINEDNLYEHVNNYLKKKSILEDDISLGTYIFHINEKQVQDNDLDTSSHVEMNINLFYNYTSIHSYAYYTNSAFNILSDFQNSLMNSEIKGNSEKWSIKENIANGSSNLNKKKIDVTNEPFTIKFHEYFLRDFYINMYVFLSIVIFFCVFFEKLKNEIEYRKVFYHFHVHKYVHYFQILLLEYFYYLIYIILLITVLYLFEYQGFVISSFFLFLMLYGFNTFLSISLFSSLYLHSSILFVFINFIFCGIVSIVIYVLAILSYAYNNEVLMNLSHVLVCIFRILDSFSLSHVLNISSLCINMKRHMKQMDENVMKADSREIFKTSKIYTYLFGTYKDVFPSNQATKNYPAGVSEVMNGFCGESSSFYNTTGDFYFLIVNCVLYLLILFYKLYKHNKARQNQNQSQNQDLKKVDANELDRDVRTHSSSQKYFFFVKHFYLANMAYKCEKDKKKNGFFKIISFVKKFLGLQKKKTIVKDSYNSFGNSESETETNASLDQHDEKQKRNVKVKLSKPLDNQSFRYEDGECEETIEKMTDLESVLKVEDDSTAERHIGKHSAEEKYILKNINVRMKPYKIYTFSSIFNHDLNVLYFFKFFFSNEKRKIGIERYHCLGINKASMQNGKRAKSGEAVKIGDAANSGEASNSGEISNSGEPTKPRRDKKKRNKRRGRKHPNKNTKSSNNKNTIINEAFIAPMQREDETNYKIVLIPDMTIYEHVKIILTYKNIILTDMELMYMIHLLMLIVNLKCDIHLRCNELSGGMKKKVELILNLLRNEKIIFLYKLNDNIDFCSQIYINTILKNIILVNEYDDMFSLGDLSERSKNHVKRDSQEEGEINQVMHQSCTVYRGDKSEKEKSDYNCDRYGLPQDEGKTTTCLISSNMQSSNENIINSYIKENILKIKFTPKIFVIYTHIYTDILYYDYLYLFNKKKITYHNCTKNIITTFKNHYSFHVKLKGIDEAKIHEYIKVFFCTNKRAFLKFRKVVNIFDQRNAIMRKKSGYACLTEGNPACDRDDDNVCDNDQGAHGIFTNSTISFIEKNAKKGALNLRNIFYIFKTVKRKKKKKKKKKKIFFTRFLKFHKVLLNLIMDSKSDVILYLNRNKYISIFLLFKFVICHLAYASIQKFVQKHKEIKTVYSEITKFNHYFFILKIPHSRHFFKLLEINQRIKFRDKEIQVQRVNINNVNANDIFLLLFKKLL
ncbi:ABC transporter [Plasmodium gonderi]|uniref:ABC transporter n=1 Tax=Plasmodium gonderi TaxID=77519 RepID=A0A1Y1JHD5_PLAGO|nr:ABC transporter [Plasmodium gonderi]GAW80627.1 ABC transporter [Plasmodium gonderi]